ncbi:hypothetical protein ACIBSW_34640 [Actinoplanes sp. NPDC049668]|uniref:hypothetical protein n=1 Tax=unclassified Actinoplanes TaxID=2626549 RepID=UPI0033A48E3D
MEYGDPWRRLTTAWSLPDLESARACRDAILDKLTRIEKIHLHWPHDDVEDYTLIATLLVEGTDILVDSADEGGIKEIVTAHGGEWAFTEMGGYPFKGPDEDEDPVFVPDDSYTRSETTARVKFVNAFAGMDTARADQPKSP